MSSKDHFTYSSTIVLKKFIDVATINLRFVFVLSFYMDLESRMDMTLNLNSTREQIKKKSML